MTVLDVRHFSSGLFVLELSSNNIAGFACSQLFPRHGGTENKLTWRIILLVFADCRMIPLLHQDVVMMAQCGEGCVSVVVGGVDVCAGFIC